MIENRKGSVNDEAKDCREINCRGHPTLVGETIHLEKTCGLSLINKKALEKGPGLQACSIEFPANLGKGIILMKKRTNLYYNCTLMSRFLCRYMQDYVLEIASSPERQKTKLYPVI